MTPLTDRIIRALRGPQARRLTDQAKQLARDPATRRRIDQLRARLTGKPAAPSTTDPSEADRKPPGGDTP
jgi:hypothetical protein